ncbi:uncharacterized protein [Symphalangus syndactylus]|uniref:uncharacterized protein isoform X2 n=1 Tax=Symphalangus syndactylus TaxID=9590 RepID=UPI00300631D2
MDYLITCLCLHGTGSPIHEKCENHEPSLDLRSRLKRLMQVANQNIRKINPCSKLGSPTLISSLSEQSQLLAPTGVGNLESPLVQKLFLHEKKSLNRLFREEATC